MRVKNIVFYYTIHYAMVTEMKIFRMFLLIFITQTMNKSFIIGNWYRNGFFFNVLFIFCFYLNIL
jgi:hypothetical protein